MLITKKHKIIQMLYEENFCKLFSGDALSKSGINLLI